jgi:hypothetical protein
MTMRKVARVALSIAATLLGCVLTVYGLIAVYKMDVRLDPGLSLLYCALPLLSLPAYLFALFRPRLILLLACFAVTYLGVYSALDWRSCAAVGICGSIWPVIWTTLTTIAVLSYFAMATCAWGALVLSKRGGSKFSSTSR